MTKAAFSPDGSRIVTGDVERRAATVWDAGLSGDAELVNVAASSTAFTPDGRYLLTGGEAGEVSVWDTTSFTELRRFGTPAPEQVVRALEVSRDGLVAAVTGDVDSLLTVSDLDTGKEAFRLRPGGYIDELAWSPDGKVLAISTSVFGPGDVTTAYGRLTFVDRSGTEVAPPYSEEEPVQILSIEFTGDGERILGTRSPIQVWAPAFGQLAVWDWRRGQLERRIDTGGYRSALSPRSDLLLSTPSGFFTGSSTGSPVAEIWDWRRGQRLRDLRNSGAVTVVTFGPDGSLLATASQDGTVGIWDPYGGEADQLVLRGHTGPVVTVSFSPDSSQLASVDEDGIVRVWALDLDDLIAAAEDGLTRTLTDDECRQYLHTPNCQQS
jgi:WD40 repeat protein